MSGKRERSNRSKRGGPTTMPHPLPWAANDHAEMLDANGVCVGLMGCPDTDASDMDRTLAYGVVARVNLHDGLVTALRAVLHPNPEEPFANVGQEIVARRVLREAEALGALGALGAGGKA
ncbi:hypothetical protein TSH7_10030 [Azospirillum sp. TSH7]|uniref:hypothetical protein n=1 Tax=unclassified Azospirillum TaxID=2630922 RepID=UPI000D620900|nr:MULTISPECIES: hypothetical protein [unclassified Azospirillum]PWC64006.1 hypothetical protein TSH20_19125 [Azospirillum sp. TSH20]PWC64869.1 hypothetical protein TSH7_10030 [Azospirillum sp. TSH7]